MPARANLLNSQFRSAMFPKGERVRLERIRKGEEYRTHHYYMAMEQKFKEGDFARAADIFNKMTGGITHVETYEECRKCGEVLNGEKYGIVSYGAYKGSYCDPCMILVKEILRAILSE